ncbi:MAG: hypothetical protein LBO67_07675 [Spirochaetaceae bacterium]|nr:hypothetical protein [Spirochaetaceae bacterium]
MSMRSDLACCALAVPVKPITALSNEQCTEAEREIARNRRKSLPLLSSPILIPSAVY